MEYTSPDQSIKIRSRLTKKNLLFVVLGIFIIVALALGAMYMVLKYKDKPGTSSNEDFLTRLIIETDNWVAPSGEVVTGIVEFTPSNNNEVSYVVSPALQSTLFGAPSFSSDANHILLQRPSRSGDLVELVHFSRSLQDAENVIATTPKIGGFRSAVWSPDISHVAYVRIPSLIGPPAEMDMEVAWASEEFGPQTYVVRFDGTGLVRLENGATPLSFSPENKHLLVDIKDKGLAIVNLQTQESVAINLDVYPQVRRIITHPNGTHIALFVQDSSSAAAESLQVYEIDWKNATLISRGSNAVSAAHVLFDSTNRLLVLDVQGTAHIYRIGETLTLEQSTPFSLSERTKLLYWASQK